MFKGYQLAIPIIIYAHSIRTCRFSNLAIRTIVQGIQIEFGLHRSEIAIMNIYLHRYYTCLNGVTFQQACAPNLYYNSHVGYCDKPGSFNFCQVHILQFQRNIMKIKVHFHRILDQLLLHPVLEIIPSLLYHQQECLSQHHRQRINRR